MSVNNVLLEVHSGTLHVRSVGSYTIDDLAQLLPEMLLKTKDLDRFSVLVEDPDGHLVPPADVSAMQEVSMNLAVFAGRLRCTAIVVSDELHFGLARATAAFEQIRGGTLRAFRDVDEARIWLLMSGKEGGTEPAY